MKYDHMEQNSINQSSSSSLIDSLDMNSNNLSQISDNSKYKFTHQELNSQILKSFEKIINDDLNAGNIEKAFGTLEKCFHHIIATNKDGKNSSFYANYLKETILNLNSIALNYVNQDQTDIAIIILEKCQIYIKNIENHASIPQLKNITYNNIACCYRKMSNLDKCLIFLQKALNIIAGLEFPELIGNTHVNLCATLSQAGNHKDALKHAIQAVVACTLDINNSGESKEKDEYGKKVTMLGISYHNLAVEHDYLGDYNSALENYKKAYETIEKFHGLNDKLAQKFKEIYEETLRKYSKTRPKIRNLYVSTIEAKAARPRSVTTKESIRNKISNIDLTLKPQGKSYFKEKHIIFPRRPNITKTTSGTNLNTRRLFFVPYLEEIKDMKLNVENDRQKNISIPRSRPRTAMSKTRERKEFKANNIFSSVFLVNSSEKQNQPKLLECNTQREIEELEQLFPNDNSQDQIKFRTNRVAFLENLNDFHESRYFNSSKQNLNFEYKIKSPHPPLHSKKEMNGINVSQNSGGIQNSQKLTQKNMQIIQNIKKKDGIISKDIELKKDEHKPKKLKFFPRRN